MEKKSFYILISPDLLHLTCILASRPSLVDRQHGAYRVAGVDLDTYAIDQPIEEVPGGQKKEKNGHS